MNNEDSSQGKLNWKLALVISAVIHVVCLGIFLLSSGSSDDEGTAATEEKAESKSTDEGGQSDSSASNDDNAQDSSYRADRSSSRTSSHRSSASTSSRTRSNGGSDRAVSGAQSGAYVNYTVKKGDNLSKIAKKHKCTETEIIKLNKIRNPNKIWVGLKLKIPAPAR